MFAKIVKCLGWSRHRYQLGNLGLTTGPVKRKGRAEAHWAWVVFVSLIAGACAMVIFRGPDLLTWANELWGKGP